MFMFSYILFLVKIFNLKPLTAKCHFCDIKKHAILKLTIKGKETSCLYWFNIGGENILFFKIQFFPVTKLTLARWILINNIGISYCGQIFVTINIKSKSIKSKRHHEENNLNLMY